MIARVVMPARRNTERRVASFMLIQQRERQKESEGLAKDKTSSPAYDYAFIFQEFICYLDTLMLNCVRYQT